MSTKNTLIVGGGLSGLFLAHRLHLAGHQVTLVEARDSLGGRYGRPSVAQPYSSPGLDFIPASQEHLALLEWLRNQSPIPLSFPIYEHRPQVFGEGRWRPFVGFGEVEFQSVGELSALFCHPSGVDLQPGLEHLTRALIEQLPFAAHTMSEVTSFKVFDGRVNEAIVNGEKSVTADTVIFTPHVVLLNSLLQGENLRAKHRTRLAKMVSWTAVTLELQHASPLVEDSALRFFTSTAKDFEPVVGRVFGNRSKWLCLVPGERALEHEFMGQCLRHIRRQITRAWPQALDIAGQNPATEKILVQANAYGQHSLRTKDTYRFPELSNLYLANHALASIPGDLGSLETVQALETELCGTLNKLPELGASC